MGNGAPEGVDLVRLALLRRGCFDGANRVVRHLYISSDLPGLAEGFRLDGGIGPRVARLWSYPALVPSKEPKARIMSHLALAPLLAAVLAVTPLARSTGVESPAATELGWWSSFPEPSSDLVIEVSPASVSPSVMKLVEQYAELTGQRFVIPGETRQLLENSTSHLLSSATVPKAEVQAFFETLLLESDFVLRIARERAPRLLAIESLRTQDRNTVRGRARFVPREHLAVMRDHPAMIFTTAIAMPYSDVRQLSNSMRTLITDANTQQCLPAGNTDSLILVGFAEWICPLVETLDAIEAAQKVAWERRAAEQPAEAKEPVDSTDGE